MKIFYKYGFFNPKIQGKSVTWKAIQLKNVIHSKNNKYDMIFDLKFLTKPTNLT